MPGAASATTRLPEWPGPVATALGFALAAGALLADELTPSIGPDEGWVLLAIGAVGAALLCGGLVYALTAQLRRRRVLPASRYRGPSIVLMLALAFCLANIVAFPLAGDVAALLREGVAPSPLGSIVLLTSTQAALLLVTWLFVVVPRALPYGPPGRRSDPLRAVASGIGWGALAWIGAQSLSVAIVLLIERLGIQPETQPAEQVLAVVDPFLLVVALVVGAPVAEEIFFRGVAFNAWLRERGPRFAYVGSALLFAAIHASLVSLLPFFALGLVLAWIYRRTRSLLAPIAMHATVNGISVAIALLVRDEVTRLPT